MADGRSVGRLRLGRSVVRRLERPSTQEAGFDTGKTTYQNLLLELRSVADSNCCTRFCRPLPNHSANRPGCKLQGKDSVFSRIRKRESTNAPFHRSDEPPSAEKPAMASATRCISHFGVDVAPHTPTDAIPSNHSRRSSVASSTLYVRGFAPRHTS